jgi:ribosomal protein S18
LRPRKFKPKSPYDLPPREAFTSKEWEIIQKYRTPRQVQKFIRTFTYNREKNGETLRSFRSTLRRTTAHCLEAAFVAATILEQYGYPPLLLDLESKDKLDHVVFAFRQGGRWGAVGRSRDLSLHGRKPLYRTLRHLVMSYVDPFVTEEARIIGYALADLRILVTTDWRFSLKNVWSVEQALIHLPHHKLKTSNYRYMKVLRRYLAFKEKFPHRQITFYSNRHQWM